MSLPDSWRTAKLLDVAEINPPLNRVVADSMQVSFVPMSAVEALTGRLDATASRPFGEIKKGFTRFADGDLVFAKITPSMENGKVALATGLHNGVGCGTTELHIIRPARGIHARYLLHYLLQSSYRGVAQGNMKGTAGQLRVPVDFLAQSQVPVPPSEEQGRIVAKIDELFSDIEEGEQCLARAEALLKRYRQAVLKAAVTGQLTRDWREKNKGHDETGADLLRRILAARRDAWEKNGTVSYHEPLPPAGSDLDELPRGWAWANLEQLEREPTRNGVSVAGRDTPPGTAALRLDAIQDGRLNYECRRYIDLDVRRVDRLRIVSGDFFVSRANGSKNLCGKAAVADTPPLTTIFPDTMIRYRLLPLQSMVDWINLIWTSISIRSQIERFAKTSAGIWKVSQADLARVSFPLPPDHERGELVARVNGAFSTTGSTSDDVSAPLGKASALRQAILRAAFSGKLVPQDPADEPASALLARIAAERAREPAAKPHRRRR